MNPASMRSSVLSAKCNRGASLPTLLLCLLLIAAAVNAERDFNVNDSQVPVIEPKDAPAYQQDPYVTELMRCQQTQPEIVLSLLLRKHDWSELSLAKRAHVQAKLAKFFAIPKEFITLDSVSKRELGNMHKLAMRKGGKGQKHVEAANRRLGRASFMIGCGSSYFSMGEPIAKQIPHQIKDGTIGALTEENFGLWFIWRKELKSRSQRKRRQSEGSGDEDDYDYGEDDEDQAAELVTVVPTSHAHRHHHGASEHEENPGMSSSSASSLPAASKLDEEIEESVSKLESVISKTIENTKNIKELPVLNVDDVDEDVEDVELQQLGQTTHRQQLGVPAAPVIVDNENELGNELELKTGREQQQQQLEQELQPTTTVAPGSSSSSMATVNLDAEDNNNNQVDTAAVAVDVAEHAATSTSQTTTNHNNNNNNLTPATPGTPMPGFVPAQTESESFSPYDASSSMSHPSIYTSSSSPAIASTIETVESSASTNSNTSSSGSGSNPVAPGIISPATASASASASAPAVGPPSTPSVVDFDMANTLTTTTTETAPSSSSTSLYPTTSSSSTTTTIATMPTTTTATTTTTTTQSQTPKVMSLLCVCV
ncbi:rho GTPase-activating protein gacF isoform X2 [Drosophila novamexicana]|uniref:rho GTPase-activating protein gacF isoform X2 n=1 Tax=Drosophila novamexicana TaxID=47314 RepID=UPI0011E5BEC6|nr:rho GTPase-activating protein gacF isoform X2 [Drosophila novamexicana]